MSCAKVLKYRMKILDKSVFAVVISAEWSRYRYAISTTPSSAANTATLLDRFFWISAFTPLSYPSNSNKTSGMWTVAPCEEKGTTPPATSSGPLLNWGKPELSCRMLFDFIGLCNCDLKQLWFIFEQFQNDL